MIVPVGKELRMVRVIPDIREYVTLEQAGLLMHAAYQMGLKREPMPDALEVAKAIVGGEG
jgi:hypothetical protein